MAKIVTITNPLTGQPAQVDQLDHTAQQIDDGLNIARGVSNPNLLDNWYFGNPVDQRGGYVVPPGVTVYDSDFTTPAGTTDKYYTLSPPNSISGGNYFFGFNGKTAYVKPENAVRGYISLVGIYGCYVLDRWRVENNIVVTFESDGVSLENVGDSAGQFNQELPPNFAPEGTLLCISAIVKSVSGDARLFLSQSSSPYGHPVDFISLLQPGLYSGSGNLLSGNHKFSIYLGAGAKIKLAAAKLELGQTQTLAHQDSAGNWVLNEIPDYGEQLRRCQYYSHFFGDDIEIPCSNNPAGTAIEGTLPLTMRSGNGTITFQDGYLFVENGTYYKVTSASVSSNGGRVKIRAIVDTTLSSSLQATLYFRGCSISFDL